MIVTYIFWMVHDLETAGNSADETILIRLPFLNEVRVAARHVHKTTVKCCTKPHSQRSPANSKSSVGIEWVVAWWSEKVGVAWNVNLVAEDQTVGSRCRSLDQ